VPHLNEGAQGASRPRGSCASLADAATVSRAPAGARSRGLALSVTLMILVAGVPCLGGTQIDLAETAGTVLYGSREGNRLGYSLATGDLDADGAADVAAGAPGFDAESGLEEAGAVLVFEAGVLTEPRGGARADTLSFLTLTGSRTHERFGAALLATDLDGDGDADLAVGAPGWGDGPSMLSGRVYVFLGPLARADRLPCLEIADVIIDGDRSGDRLGTSLACGDVDGDGRAELLASAPRALNRSGLRAGSVYVFDIGALAERGARVSVSEASLLEIQGKSEGDALSGIAVASGSEGLPAVLALGAYQADGRTEKDIDAGRAYLLAVDDLADTSRIISVGSPAVTVILGPHPRSLLGRSIAAGDVDGDGSPDLVVSAYASRGRGSKADASGEAFVIYGPPTAWPDSVNLSDEAVPRFRSESRWDLFGLPAMLSDLNGDGRAELMVSAQFADLDGRRRCGKIYIFRGGPRSVVMAKAGKADLADVTLIGPARLCAIGGALATAPGAGRYPDLIIGAPDAGSATAGKAAGMVLLAPSSALTGY